MSVFYSSPSLWYTRTGGHADGGVGLALSHAFSPTFSMQLSVGRESYSLFANRTVTNGMFTYDRVRVRTNPFDLTARYHFVNDTRWKPYVGAGLRYVATHEVAYGSFSRFDSWIVEPEVAGGVLFQLRPRIGLLLEGKQLVGGHDLRSDPSFKASLGLAWRW